jgi:putative hemolysin
VFAEEMGANLTTTAIGLDIDEFDEYRDHLVVRDTETLQVVGNLSDTSSGSSKRIGRLYSQSEF